MLPLLRCSTFPSHVQRTRIGVPRQRPHLRRVLAAHQRQAGGWEHAAGGIKLFGEKLGDDEGVLAPEAGDLPGNEFVVGWNFGGDAFGVDAPDAADAVLFLGGLGGAQLSGQEGGGRPRRAPEDAGGIGAGGHRGDVFVPFGDFDVLGFVAFEQSFGGVADYVSGGCAGEEDEAGGFDAVDVAGFFFPAAASEQVPL